MGRLFNIINGWANFITKPDAVYEVAEARAKICAKCPYAVKKELLTFVKGEFKEIAGEACEKCSCPLPAKVWSINEKCPLEKW